MNQQEQEEERVRGLRAALQDANDALEIGDFDEYSRSKARAERLIRGQVA